MAEPYIKQLQREKAELIDAYKRVIEWHKAMDYANTTGRKGDAFRIVDEKRAEMEAAKKIIEPLLAEKEI